LWAIPDWLLIAGVGLVVAGAAAILYMGDPAISPIFPPCPFHWLTGLWCPGCGSARALNAILHGSVAYALDLNPLLVLSLPFLAYAAVSRVLTALRGWGLPRVFTGAVWGWLVLCAVVVFWVARNIPYYPFTILAP
jgi:hypothetical protein